MNLQGMILKNKENFEGIFKCLKECYYSDTSNDYKAEYHKSFDELLTLIVPNIVENDNVDMLAVNVYTELPDEISDNPETEVAYDVYGYSSTDPEKTPHGLEFTAWNRWLPLVVDEQTVNTFTEEEILAHCLWEMTFVGFDQSSIKDAWEEIMQSKKELETLSAEEKAYLTNYDIKDFDADDDLPPWEEAPAKSDTNPPTE